MENDEPDTDAIPDVDAETAIRFGLIDLQIEDVLRDLFNDLEEYELEDIDRTLLTFHLRMAYCKGWTDGHNGELPLSEAETRPNW